VSDHPSPPSSGAPALPSLKERIRADLEAAGCRPLHRFGQNFMVDPSAVAALVDALDLTPGERVLEIGPGTGVLTEQLLKAGAVVLAVELDRGLHAHLASRYADHPRFTVVHGDALASKSRLHPEIEAFAKTPWKFGANLPFEVSIPVLLNAVDGASGGLPPQRIAVTVQREAAERLCAAPGSDAWGASAATMQTAGQPAILRRLPPHCFFPQPRVDSVIMTWTPGSAMPSGFGLWCRSIFAYRRKVLPRALRDVGCERDDTAAILAAAELTADLRVEQLDVASLRRLHASSREYLS
jgi:16S rRNA (adenine1518-N6/adenine1519-N6)-dimethyltransferase